MVRRLIEIQGGLEGWRCDWWRSGVWVTVDGFSLREVLRQRTWKKISRIGADKPVGGGETRIKARVRWGEREGGLGGLGMSMTGKCSAGMGGDMDVDGFHSFLLP